MGVFKRVCPARVCVFMRVSSTYVCVCVFSCVYVWHVCVFMRVCPARVYVCMGVFVFMHVCVYMHVYFVTPAITVAQ